MSVADTTERSRVDEIIKAWPKTSREAVAEMREKYGPPDEACAGRLIWHNNGPWKRSVVYNEEVPHHFPTPHVDVLEQYIAYRVPVDKFDDLGAYDGSVIIDRTKGEISARCQGEAANFLALNLAHDIVQGRRSVEDARRAYGEAMKARKQGNPPEIMQRFLFEVPRDGTGDLDQPVM
jgi:hypothetical protein